MDKIRCMNISDYKKAVMEENSIREWIKQCIFFKTGQSINEFIKYCSKKYNYEEVYLRKNFYGKKSKVTKNFINIFCDELGVTMEDYEKWCMSEEYVRCGKEELKYEKRIGTGKPTKEKIEEAQKTRDFFGSYIEEQQLRQDEKDEEKLNDKIKELFLKLSFADAKMLSDCFEQYVNLDWDFREENFYNQEIIILDLYNQLNSYGKSLLKEYLNEKDVITDKPDEDRLESVEILKNYRNDDKEQPVDVLWEDFRKKLELVSYIFKDGFREIMGTVHTLNEDDYEILKKIIRIENNREVLQEIVQTAESLCAISSLRSE